MSHLPGLDRWLTTDPREAAAEGNYSAPLCGNSFNREVQPASLGEDLLSIDTYLGDVSDALAAGDTEKALRALARARKRTAAVASEAASMPMAYDVECNHEGDVDAAFYGGRSAYTACWDCPTCGKAREDEREVGDDHPDL